MKNIYSVTQVNSYIRNMFTQDFMLQSIRVRGEISNCKYHSSGHIYFTLKDAKAAIACVMFAGSRSGLAFRLQEGQQVVVDGGMDVYERDGKYQLYARAITRDGTGQLYERFEQLKRELAELGMFAEEYKRPIPEIIRTLGVVTAPTGAAVRDIIQIASRRNPYVQMILYPAIVQGDQAVASIINGIHALTAFSVDVIIVGRGGGSIEDLWAFNEREVAQAIFDCPVPIISAVGHETDTTIADFAADLRAPTPSAAAELAVCEFSRLEEKMEEYATALYRGMMGRCERYRRRAEMLGALLRGGSPAGRLKQNRMYLMRLEERLQASMRRQLDGKRHILALYTEKLRGLSPLDKLSQGFSWVTDEHGRGIRDVDETREGQLLVIHMKNGIVHARVEGKDRVIR
ncbi:MAG: exodeoxyribonuclease VII large subunit [Lachnospiraceae bacterium]|jgi:exodeoxyribonuclease VII large subunit|nr:exodeoxyribonuclease VII large subunit [Lachnospiraceae bacterium]